MKNIDRRHWLKTVGLTSSFALLGGLESMALDFPRRTNLADSMVLLNANENPYGPSERVRKILTNSFDEACRYPFRSLSGLVEMIALKEGVTKDHVVVTGGSTEGLKATGLVYGLGNGEIISADPTFQAMLRYAETFKAKVHRVPLNENLEHDLLAMSEKINKNTRLIFICNPNNPTGTILNKTSLLDFCKSYDKDAVIFSDEAYYDFITEPEYPSMVELVKEGRNIIVSKTFSKVYGLAGLRVGYLITKPEIARNLKSAVMANTNILAIEAAKEALRDDEFYKFSVMQNFKAKSLIYRNLDDLGLDYVKSHTNFVFFKTGRSIQTVINDMKKQNVLIGRPFPPLNNWARISTGKLEDMETFGQALKQVMS